MEKSLKLIVPENFIKFGRRVNNHINLIRNTNENYLVDLNLVRFNNGEGKGVLGESVRDMDIYIMTDIGNYDITYKNRKGQNDEESMDSDSAGNAALMCLRAG